MKSLRRVGSRVAARASCRSSRLPPKNCSSVSTESAAAPADLVGLRHLGRVEVLADDAARGRAPLELGDHVDAARPRRARPRRAAGRWAWAPPRQRGRAAALRSPLLHALARARQRSAPGRRRALMRRDTSPHPLAAGAAARPSSRARAGLAARRRAGPPRGRPRPAPRPRSAAPRPARGPRAAVQHLARDRRRSRAASPPAQRLRRAGASRPASSGRDRERPHLAVVERGDRASGRASESSSRPAAVHDPGARARPGGCRQRARNSVSSGRGTPTTCASGRAGLVSGPEQVERGAHAELLARRRPRGAWRRGSRARTGTPSPPRRGSAARSPTGGSIRTPSASSTSALPQLPAGRAVAVLGHRHAAGRPPRARPRWRC